jgi:AbiV family abortive infection protein
MPGSPLSSTAYIRRVRMKGWTRRIGPTTYARGVTVSLDNARSLLEEALILFEAKRWARASALAILALEEGDKVRRLLHLTLASGDAKKEWDAFRRHGPRLSASLSLLTHGDYSLLHRSWASIRPKRGGNTDLPHVVEILRERCLHADLLRDGTWSVPRRMVPRPVCAIIIAMVDLFLGLTTSLSLGTDMVVGGQLDPEPGQVRPDLGSTKRGKKWMQWRMSKAGQSWGARELSRHLRWTEGHKERMGRVLRSSGLRIRRAKSSDRRPVP